MGTPHQDQRSRQAYSRTYRRASATYCRHLRELEDELQRRGLLSAQASAFTHQLELLLRLAQGLDRLRQSEELWRLFNMVNRWVPAWRYTADLSNPDDAADFLGAVSKVSQWIDHNI